MSVGLGGTNVPQFTVAGGLFAGAIAARHRHGVCFTHNTAQHSMPHRAYTMRSATGALVAPQTSWTLTSAQTSPAFDPRDSTFVSGNATLLSALRAAFPDNVGLIARLTSF